ncbi:MAG: folylpolyglutamate synthase/dihydrofolate synthase family protein [Vicinamibacterales bacterium]
MDPFEYLLSLEKFGIKFGLANIETLTSALGHPQKTFKSILVAGTNGKGSVTAMVDCALGKSGLRVGRYTSPHLVHLEERFAIDGAPVRTEVLSRMIEDVRTLIDKLVATGSLEAPPTFFEVTTAIAFELFRRAGVQIAVLEVGLGGRLDSTNIAQPIAAAITSIDFDHEQYLGNTRAAIAAEKAGVIRRDIPVIVGPVPTEARDVLVSMCDLAGAEFIEADSNVRIKSKIEDGRTILHLRTPTRDYGWVPLGLRGDHQVPNTLVAVRLLEELGRVVNVPAESIVAGIRDVKWAGRLQMVEVPDGRRVLLDAAHNPAGAWVLASYLKREFPEPLPIVFGAMRDKDVALMLKNLLPAASAMVMTEAATPRAHSAAELAQIARKIAPKAKIDVEPDPKRALERAWRRCPVACVAGSIFLVGDILGALGPSVRDL